MSLQLIYPDRRSSSRSDKLIHPLYCTITGVPLGELSLRISGGHMPYLSHWKEQICHHPYFSMESNKLIAFIRDEWNRTAKELSNEAISEQEAINLRVGFVAMLHNLGSIRQDTGIRCLPEIGIVQSNLESLAGLASWKNYLDSKRFSFPDYHISRGNNNSDLRNISDYLETCWQKKKEYEQGMDDIQEKEKAKIAEKAILAIRNTFLKPPSKKLLWQWVRANLDKKWEADGQGWLATIFLGNQATVAEFDWDELELFEEIIQSSCPNGNASIMHAVRERIDEIKKNYREHYDAFTIEEDGLSFIQAIKTEVAASPAPLEKDFPSKAMFFVARARWELANPTILTQQVKKEVENARSKMIRSEDL